MTRAFILLFLSLAASSFAVDKRLKSIEDSLKTMHKALYSIENDQLKLEKARQFEALLSQGLQLPNSFDHKFDSLTEMSRLVSDDKKVRVFSWDLPLSDGTYRHFGFIQVFSKKAKRFITHKLIDYSDQIRSIKTHRGNQNKWYGAVYYKLVTYKIKKQTKYYLLGFDGNTNRSNKKCIEPLKVDQNGNIMLGSTDFKIDGKMQSRVVFEYNEDVTMSLRYDKKSEYFVFDHLAPNFAKTDQNGIPNNALEGLHEFYGPDFSYDALTFKNGKWIEKKDIKPRNTKRNIDKLYNKPPRAPFSVKTPR